MSTRFAVLPSKSIRRHAARREVVADDFAAFHHELHALQLRDVGNRIARHRDDVGEFAFLDGADLIAFQEIVARPARDLRAGLARTASGH